VLTIGEWREVYGSHAAGERRLHHHPAAVAQQTLPSSGSDGCAAALTRTSSVTPTPAGDGFMGDWMERAVAAFATGSVDAVVAASNAASPEYETSTECTPEAISGTLMVALPASSAAVPTGR